MKYPSHVFQNIGSNFKSCKLLQVSKWCKFHNAGAKLRDRHITNYNTYFTFVLNTNESFKTCCMVVLLTLSIFSAFYSASSHQGCEFARLHLKAVDDKGRISKIDHYVGLGLFTHQSLTKNGYDALLLLDTTCQSYEEEDSRKGFFTHGFKSTEALMLYSFILTGFVSLSLFITIALAVLKGTIGKTNEINDAILFMFVAMVTVISLTVQILAINKIHDAGGICDRGAEFLPDEWFSGLVAMYASELNSSYLSFIHVCKLGPDGERAFLSIILNGATVGAAILCVFAMMVDIHCGNKSLLIDEDDDETVCEDEDEEEDEEKGGNDNDGPSDAPGSSVPLAAASFLTSLNVNA